MRIRIEVGGFQSQSATDPLVPHHRELMSRIHRMFKSGEVADPKEALRDFEDYERAIMGAQHHCDLGYAQQLELPEFSRGGSYGNRSRNWAVNVIKGLKDTSLSRHELSKILRGQKHYRSKK